MIYDFCRVTRLDKARVTETPTVQRYGSRTISPRDHLQVTQSAQSWGDKSRVLST